MAYYREHSIEGRDAASLADLRRRCAAILSERLGLEVGVETLMDAIRFQPFPDAAPALSALRARGLATVCVSNWDISLGTRAGAVRAELGPGRGRLHPPRRGRASPSPEIFERALAIAGCAPEQAVHVGDTPEEDSPGPAPPACGRC